VRVRDGWVEIGGNRTGSFLIAWGEEPLLSYATDPEHFSEEPLFLLGVAHQGCLAKARARLLADGPFESSKLTPLNVERGPEVPWPQYTLDRPAEAEACPFCDSRNHLTDEHIWPIWYSKELGKRGAKLSGQAVVNGRIDITVPVCATCNNRWMSVLESDAGPLLISMTDAASSVDSKISLSSKDQARLATWAVKTAYLIDVYQQPSIVPRGFLHQLALQRRPNNNTVVWLAGFTPDSALRAEKRALNFLTNTGERTHNSPNAFAVTFTILNVLFQVLGNFNDEHFTLRDERHQYQPALFRIWPNPEESLAWPPAFGFSSKSWSGLVDSINDR
jgi:hypothetical protein